METLALEQGWPRERCLLRFPGKVVQTDHPERCYWVNYSAWHGLLVVAVEACLLYLQPWCESVVVGGERCAVGQQITLQACIPGAVPNYSAAATV